MTQPPRPYQGKKLTRTEQRAIHKRAQRRAASMAKGMPPPEKGARVDPISGQPLYGTGLPSPGTSARHTPPSVAASAPAAAPPTAPTWMNAPGTLPGNGSPAPAPGGRPLPPRRSTDRPRRRKKDRALVLPSLEDAFNRAATPSVTQRLLAPAAPGSARWLYCAGLVLMLAAVMAGVGAGLPVLGHAWDLTTVGAAIGALLLGCYLAYTGWFNTPLKPRLVAGVLAGVLGAAFCMGVASHPVIINGHVLLSTSKDARSAELANTIYVDLRRSSKLDDLLTASLADARANVSLYQPAVDELTNISARYADMPKASLPDPSFGPVVDAMKTSAYWGAQAMTTKLSLIDQEDAQAESDLQTQRATFADNWLTTAKTLQQVTTALGIPLSTELEGPHE